MLDESVSGQPHDFDGLRAPDPQSALQTGLSDRDLLGVRVEELLVQRRAEMIRPWLQVPENQRRIDEIPHHVFEVIQSFPHEAIDAISDQLEAPPEEREELSAMADAVTDEMNEATRDCFHNAGEAPLSAHQIAALSERYARALIGLKAPEESPRRAQSEEMAEMIASMGPEMGSFFDYIDEELCKDSLRHEAAKSRVVGAMTEIAEQHGFDFILDPEVERHVIRQLFRTEDKFLSEMDPTVSIHAASKRALARWTAEVKDPMTQMMIPILAEVMDRTFLALETATDGFRIELLLLDAARIFGRDGSTG